MNPCQRDGKEKGQRMRISEKTCTGPGGQGLPVVESGCWRDQRGWVGLELGALCLWMCPRVCL